MSVGLCQSLEKGSKSHINYTELLNNIDVDKSIQEVLLSILAIKVLNYMYSSERTQNLLICLLWY